KDEGEASQLRNRAQPSQVSGELLKHGPCGFCLVRAVKLKDIAVLQLTESKFSDDFCRVGWLYRACCCFCADQPDRLVQPLVEPDLDCDQRVGMVGDDHVLHQGGLIDIGEV